MITLIQFTGLPLTYDPGRISWEHYLKWHISIEALEHHQRKNLDQSTKKGPDVRVPIKWGDFTNGKCEGKWM